MHWVHLDCNKSPIQNHMRYALSCTRVKRQKYYSGQVDGTECTALMTSIILWALLWKWTSMWRVYFWYYSECYQSQVRPIKIKFYF